jgi:predicted enzyme related to lactoylglutathione lyase
MKDLERIIPHIPSKNIGETSDFMSKVFGFKSSSQTEFYSELSLGNKTLGILASDGEPNQQSIYLQVGDVDTLWSKVESKLKEVKTKAPFNQQYGMREFHLIIPATNTLLFVGAKLNA